VNFGLKKSRFYRCTTRVWTRPA